MRLINDVYDEWKSDFSSLQNNKSLSCVDYDYEKESHCYTENVWLCFRINNKLVFRKYFKIIKI